MRLIKALVDMGLVLSPKGTSAGINDIRFQAVFFIGPSGSGKSFVRDKRYLKYMRFNIIDPDKIKKQHPDFDPEDPARLHEWSKEVADSKFFGIINKGQGDPLVVDGTGAHPQTLARKMSAAKDAGYRIFLIYVKVPFEISIFRNRNRDRFVPEEVVIRQFEIINKSFGILRRIAEKSKVIPNFSSAELQKAQNDIELYPVPQAKRPPRPGDKDYGVAVAASWIAQAAELILQGRNVP
jgi:predicted ABC-type ATPase